MNSKSPTLKLGIAFIFSVMYIVLSPVRKYSRHLASKIQHFRKYWIECVYDK